MWRHGQNTVYTLYKVTFTLPLALLLSAVIKPWGINSMGILEIKELDIWTAFDRIWHAGLLYKLKKAGITGILFKWFEHYLSGRKQRVVLPGANSLWVAIKAGVPQGSILGPLLFLVFINDIVNELNSTVRLFADDTSLIHYCGSPPKLLRPYWMMIWKKIIPGYNLASYI